MRDDGPIVREVAAATYVIPTDAPEADGTLAWDLTTMVHRYRCNGGERRLRERRGQALRA